MRILHIITGLEDGGAEAVLFRLCRFDKEHQHQVISLGGDGKYGPLLRSIGIPVTCLDMKSVGGFQAFSRLVRIIREDKPDAIQTWMYHANFIGGLAARLAGVKNITWGLHSTSLDPARTRLSTRVVVALNRLSARFIPRHIISCSRRATLEHVASGYREAKMTTIPNGYDLDEMRFDAQRRAMVRYSLNLPHSDTPVIGMIARYNPQKDHKTYLEALAILKRRGIDFHAVMAGYGADVENQELSAMVLSNDLIDRVHALGPRSDIADVYSALDLSVLSSAYGEAFPNVIAEAMSCGTPVVTTDVGDAAFMVGNLGQVVPPKSPRVLADAIEFSLRATVADGVDLRPGANELRKHVQDNFSIERMAARYARIWTSGTSKK